MKSFLAVIILLVLVAMPSLTAAAEAGYPVPDLKKAKLILDENQLVAKGGPVINIQTYRNPDGSEVRTYSVGGSIFRYDVKPNPAGPFEYRLLDKNGDGIFETKESLVGEIIIKEKGQKYFIDLGPEPGKEYKYGWEENYDNEARHLSQRESIRLIEGYPIYIPPWIILRFGKP